MMLKKKMHVCNVPDEIGLQLLWMNLKQWCQLIEKVVRDEFVSFLQNFLLCKKKHVV